MSPQELQQKVDGAIANYLNENKSYEGTQAALRIFKNGKNVYYYLLAKKSPNENYTNHKIELNDVAKLDALTFLFFKSEFEKKIKSYFDSQHITYGNITIKNINNKNEYKLYIENDKYVKEVKINEII